MQTFSTVAFFLLNLVDQCQMVSMYVTHKHTPDFAFSTLGNGICHSLMVDTTHGTRNHLHIIEKVPSMKMFGNSLSV